MNLVNPYINNSLYSAMPLPNHSTGFSPATPTLDFRTLLLYHIKQAMQMNNTMNLVTSSANHPISSFSPNVSFLPMMMNYLPQANIHPSGFNYMNNMSQYNYPNNYQISNHSNYYPAQNTLRRQPPTAEFNHLISQAAQKYNVDENLIHAIIKMESNYNPDTVSHKGAVGLMQLRSE